MMRFTPTAKNLTKLLDIKSLKLLDHYSHFNPSPLSIHQFIEFGRCATEADSFHFLVKELPVRMSNIMKEINLLPSNLLQSPAVIEVQEWYADSFKDLCQYDYSRCDPKTLESFQKTLTNIQRQHKNVVQQMAQGVLELKESHSVDLHTEMSIQYFLDRFYMSRISMKMLMNQHSVLFDEQEKDPNIKRIGIFDPEAGIKNIVTDAFNHASFLCEEYYSLSPDINIKLCNVQDPGKPITLVYPPQHLYHILFELFKNAMRAVIENKSTPSSTEDDIPDIDVLIARGEHDVTIRISDQGGGIPRHVTDNLFHYLFSTAPRPSMTPTRAPLAGYGYGLPLSRLYARYFHGDLILNSYDGYGTDAVIYLKTHKHEASELLPVFNKTSSKQYKASVPTADWTDPNSSMNRHFNPIAYNSKAKNPTPTN